MKKEAWYRYLGTNGVIESPVHLEDIYYVRITKLIADQGKRITNGEIVAAQKIVPESEVDLWYEVDWVPTNN